jgi:Ca2+-dependent lipid-binding protein
MDLYVIIQVRQQEFRTKSNEEGGKKPTWGECFDIDVKKIGDKMTVKVMNSDIDANDKMCTSRIKLSSFCVNGGFDEWYEIYYKGEPAGKINL